MGCQPEPIRASSRADSLTIDPAWHTRRPTWQWASNRVSDPTGDVQLLDGRIGYLELHRVSEASQWQALPDRIRYRN